MLIGVGTEHDSNGASERIWFRNDKVIVVDTTILDRGACSFILRKRMDASTWGSNAFLSFPPPFFGVSCIAEWASYEAHLYMVPVTNLLLPLEACTAYKPKGKQESQETSPPLCSPSPP